MKIEKFFEHNTYKEGEEWIQDLCDDIELEYPNLRIYYNKLQKYWKSSIYIRFKNYHPNELTKYCDKNIKEKILNHIFSSVEIIEEKSNMRLYGVDGKDEYANSIHFIENMDINGPKYRHYLSLLLDCEMVVIEFIPKNSTWRRVKL